MKPFEELVVVDNVDSVHQAIESIRDHDPHLVFLDIEMPPYNGFDLLEKVDAKFDVIFTTAFDQYAIKAIKYSALDYLLKPIDPEELKKAILRFVSKVHDEELLTNKFKTLLNNINEPSSNQTIAIPDGEGLNFVQIKDIVRFQSEGSYTKMYLLEGKPMLISKPIGDYEEMLSNDRFFRIHRSHLINLDHISKYVKGEGGYVVMKDKSNVEVSRRKKADFIQLLMLQ